MKKRWFLIFLVLLIGFCLQAGAQFKAGGVYFALNKDEATLDHDLARIKELGYDNIKLPTWPWTTPTLGSKLVPWTGMFLEKLEQYDLTFTLLHNIQYNTVINAYDAYLSTQIGKDVEPEQRRDNCFLGKSLSTTIRPWVQLLRQTDRLDGIILGNEVGPERRIKQPEMLLDVYHDYCLTVHGNLEGINEAWGTSYTKVSEIEFPQHNPDPYGRSTLFWPWQLPENDAGFIDFIRFSDKLFVDFYNNMFTKHIFPIRDDVDYSLKTDTNPFVQKSLTACNLAGWDGGASLYPQWRLKAMTDISGKVGYNSEQHLYGDFYYYRGTPEIVHYRYFMDTLNGILQTANYTYDDWTKEYTDNGYKTEVMLEANRQVISDLRRTADYVISLYETAPLISAVLTEENYYLEPQVYNKENFRPALLYCALAARGLPWQYISEDQIANVKTPYLLLWTNRITADAMDALANLPLSTQIICLEQVPELNEYGLPLAKELVDVVRSRSSVIAASREPAELISQLMVIAPEYGSRDGVFLESGIQKMNFWGDKITHYDLECPYPVIEVRQKKTADGYFFAVINHMNKERIIPLPVVLDLTAPGITRVIDLLTNEEVDITLDMKAYEVKLLLYKID